MQFLLDLAPVLQVLVIGIKPACSENRLDLLVGLLQRSSAVILLRTLVIILLLKEQVYLFLFKEWLCTHVSVSLRRLVNIILNFVIDGGG